MIKEAKRLNDEGVPMQDIKNPEDYSKLKVSELKEELVLGESMNHD